MLRVLVTGGRDYKQWELVEYALDQLREFEEISMIIHGYATGADALGGRYARENGIMEVRVPANWTYFEEKAGPIRNSWLMKLNPDIVVAFPGGTGTADMKAKAENNSILVWDVEAGQSIFDFLKGKWICDDCGVKLARRFGQLEMHKADCPNIPF